MTTLDTAARQTGACASRDHDSVPAATARPAPRGSYGPGSALGESSVGMSRSPAGMDPAGERTHVFGVATGQQVAGAPAPTPTCWSAHSRAAEYQSAAFFCRLMSCPAPGSTKVARHPGGPAEDRVLAPEHDQGGGMRAGGTRRVRSTR